MIIDPKTVDLDALERLVLLDALVDHIRIRKRKAGSTKNAINQYKHDDRIARAEDLIEKLNKL